MLPPVTRPLASDLKSPGFVAAKGSTAGANREDSVDFCWLVSEWYRVLAVLTWHQAYFDMVPCVSLRTQDELLLLVCAETD